jgi:hypothetical protein
VGSGATSGVVVAYVSYVGGKTIKWRTSAAEETQFTCTWSVVHINFPRKEEGYWAVVKRKSRWVLLAIYAPEAVTLTAACQWSSARRSRNAMRKISGAEHWTISHSFFADGGGFFLHTPDFTPFPINTRAIHYLLEQGHIQPPAMTREEIWERSKADKFTKVVALSQSMYLLIQCATRWKQSLGVSPLGVITLAFLWCTAATYCFWMEKPFDVGIPVPIHTTKKIAAILLEAGDIAKESYKETPMDFVEQPGWTAWSQRKLFQSFDGVGVKPLRRIPNDYVLPPQTLRLAFGLWGLTVLHAAIHVLKWNFEFPTTLERILWRGSSLALLTDLFVWGLVEVMSVKPGFNYTVTLLGIWEKRTTSDSIWRHWAVDGPATISAIAYFVARMMLIVEMFFCMRSLPGYMYETVEWTNLLPHF